MSGVGRLWNIFCIHLHKRNAHLGMHTHTHTFRQNSNTDVEAAVETGVTSLKTGIYIQEHAKQGVYIYRTIFVVSAHGGS